MADPRYDSNSKRMAAREELREMINARMAGQSRDHWLAILNAAGVPCGLVQDLHQVFNDPQVAAQKMAIGVPFQDGPTVKVPGFPIKLGATPCRIHRPVPRLGGGTRTILTEIGLSEDDIVGLFHRKVVSD